MKKDDVVFFEGKEGKAFFIIIEGGVNLHVDNKEKHKEFIKKHGNIKETKKLNKFRKKTKLLKYCKKSTSESKAKKKKKKIHVF